MPSYLAPGVFVEELTLRPPGIAGADMGTAGFIGPCRWGPPEQPLDAVSSLAEFERHYGDGRALQGGASGVNHLWQAARCFFLEGGRRLRVCRVFRPLQGPATTDLQAPAGAALHADGRGRLLLGSAAGQCRLIARHPGALGNLQLDLTLTLGPPAPALAEGDVVWLDEAARVPAPASNPAALAELPLYVAQRDDAGTWWLAGGPRPAGGAAGASRFTLAELGVPGPAALRVLTLALQVRGAEGQAMGQWQGLPLAPSRPGGDGLCERWGLGVADAAALPLVWLNGGAPGQGLLADGLALLRVLAPDGAVAPAELAQAGGSLWRALAQRLARGLALPSLRLSGGNDGLPPTRMQYQGQVLPAPGTGLAQLDALTDIAALAAPGAGDSAQAGELGAIQALLIAQAGARQRLALIDAPPGLSPVALLDWRAGLNSAHAALYHPWLRVQDPLTGQRLDLPPSGALAGLYARNDLERGVFKAPANLALRCAVDLTQRLDDNQQAQLNPEGINVLRLFPDRGPVVWGARLLCKDPEWRYVSQRRYMDYLARSLEAGLAWVAFEPGGEPLWARVRLAVGDFLQAEWRAGALQGQRVEQACWVRCDRSTHAPDEAAQGRVVCLLGVALLRPAEFQVLRLVLQAGGGPA